MQQVYRSKTQSGIDGLFTSNMMAWPLRDPAAFDALTLDQKRAFCARLEFEYVEHESC